jgi:hypothetical protein
MTDVFWDEIEEIEYINPEDLENTEYVYDFSVEDVETFATKEGLIVHNTLNSIDYNEKVVIRVNKKRYMVVKIGDFIEKINNTYNKKYKEYFEKGDQTYIEVNKQNENYDIYAVDFDGNYKWCELQAVTRHLPLVNGKRDNLIKITLESGRTAIGTKAKSFLRFNKEQNKLEQCGGDKIQIGDYVPIVKHFRVPKKEQLTELNIEEFFPKTEYIYGSEVINALQWKNIGIYSDNCNKKCNWFKRFNNDKFILPYKRSDTFIDGLRGRVKNSEIPQKGYIYQKKSTSKNNTLKLPEKFELDELFGFFIGAYLAEGLSNKNQVKISNNDKDFRNKIYDLCDKYNIGYYTTKRLFGDNDSKVIKSYTYRNRNENDNDETTTYVEYKKMEKYRNGTSTDITIYNTMLSKLLKILCNTGSKNKVVPEFAYLANDIFVKGLLDGYISGDGTITKSTFSYSTISKDLGYGIALLLKRYNIHTKIKKYNENRKLHYNDCYTFILKNYKNFKYLSLTIKYKMNRLFKQLNRRETKLNYFENNIIEQVIKKEEIESSHKYVYDFTVKDNPNFEAFNGIPLKNTFHYSGVSSKSNVNQGVPRIRELISATKNQKTPSLTIYLKKEMNKKDECKNVVNNIVNTQLIDFVNQTSIHYDPNILNSNIEEDRQFVKEYYDFFNDVDFNQLSPWVLRIEFNDLFLINKNIDLFEIYHNLMENYIRKKIHIIHSDINASKVVFHIRFTYQDINAIDENDIYITNGDVKLLKKLEEDILNNNILKGINNINGGMIREIKEQYVKKDGSIDEKKQFVIDTTGTNLNDILDLFDVVDQNKTFSNDLHEVNATLGVEAARQLLKNEINGVMSNSGIYLNDKHLNLLCDLMTIKGSLISMDRHGIVKLDNGPLQKASFEEPHEHFMKSCIFNTTDHMKSLVSNLMFGQVGKYGTGMVDVVFNTEKFNKYKYENKILREKGRKIIKLN